MNYKQKLGYTLFGALIMLIGMVAATLISPPIIAQHNGVFDEIQCNRLIVVDKAGYHAITLDTTEYGNNVAVRNKDGNSVSIGTSGSGSGSGMVVFNKEGNIAISLSANESNNNMVIYKENNTAVRLSNTEHGGRIDVFNNEGENRATMSVNEYGNGAVSTWDKNGYRQ